jgi:enolase-phosphatase E1
VSAGLRAAGIEVVLLDIEGTTTPIAFVHQVLFPYARARLASWFAARPQSDQAVRKIVDDLQREAAGDPDAPPAGGWTREDVVARLTADIDRDRKSPALKTVQGLIWEDGYVRGELRGEVYDDVPPAFARWTDGGIAVGIFSSGSVLAQKLLFAHSNAGDLTPFLRWHFDTAVGPKTDARSYARIAEAVGAPPSTVLFISDVTAELRAARDAGMRGLLCVRPLSPPAAAEEFPVVRTFDDVERTSLASPSAG